MCGLGVVVCVRQWMHVWVVVCVRQWMHVWVVVCVRQWMHVWVGDECVFATVGVKKSLHLPAIFV